MSSKLQQFIKDTNAHIIAAVADIEQKAETGELIHQNLTVVNVGWRETIQLFLIVQRVFKELMPAIDEIGERMIDLLDRQEAIEGHAYEEMETLRDVVHRLRNVATASNNLEAVFLAKMDADK